MKKTVFDQSRLKGNTLKVYLYCLKHKALELREIQKALNFSTASLASYHLSKLVESGHIKRNEDGTYSPEKDVTSELLDGYTRIGVKIVPQLLFLSIVLTALVGYFSYQSLVSQNLVVYLVIVSIASVLLLWFETIKLWRKLVTWT